MQVGQGLTVIEPLALRHEPFDQLQHAVGPVDKAAQRFVSVGSFSALPALIEEAFGARRILGRRQIQEGEEIGGLVVSPFFLELGSAFSIHQGRCHIRATARRIGIRWISLRLHKHRPA